MKIKFDAYFSNEELNIIADISELGDKIKEELNNKGFLITEKYRITRNSSLSFQDFPENSPGKNYNN
ncbi:MAG: hypothetical protein K0R12_540 [Gammaproteobacteria bacterium]|jgi:hypothetical protein|nr:hypothetical protein [Gammaproteobacteria bacterium]